jgi:CRISPR/Cas system-associated exonuclease Cas4 (RecB family)
VDIISEIIKAVVNDPDKKESIGASTIASTCLRKAYYMIKGFENIDYKTAGRFFRGKAIHNELLRRMRIFGWQVDLPESPFEVEFKGIKMHPDAFKDGVLIDLKVVDFLPRSDSEATKYYEHYYRQVQYYAVALRANGCSVRQAYLVFINLEGGFNPVAYEVPLDIIGIEDEIVERYNKLVEAIAKDEPPERNVGLPYPCSYCHYIKQCWGEEIDKEAYLQGLASGRR